MYFALFGLKDAPSGTVLAPSDVKLAPLGIVLAPSDVKLAPSEIVLAPWAKGFELFDASKTLKHPSDLQASGLEESPTHQGLADA